MRLERVSPREYRCGDDRWFAIALIDGRWRVTAGGATIGRAYETRREAAAALASMLRDWRTSI